MQGYAWITRRTLYPTWPSLRASIYRRSLLLMPMPTILVPCRCCIEPFLRRLSLPRGEPLLMEVMLADALKIMAKRAAEEMELPLYPEELVSGMLMQVRPMPIEEPFTVPILPGITIHASRAGHIAGAVSLGFRASAGSIVVSGDIGSTPQRPVLGATPPPLN